MSRSASWAKVVGTPREADEDDRNTLVDSSAMFGPQQKRELAPALSVIFLWIRLAVFGDDTADLRERLFADTFLALTEPFSSRNEEQLCSALVTLVTALDPLTGVGLVSRTNGEKLEFFTGHDEVTLHDELGCSKAVTSGSLGLQVGTGRELGFLRCVIVL